MESFMSGIYYENNAQPSVEERQEQLHHALKIPKDHVDYLHKMNIKPKVVYDLGSCVLHWAREAKTVWPDADIVLFEAMDEVKSLYEKFGYKKYSLGVVSDVDGKKVRFYQRLHDPGGNSYYKENTNFYQEQHVVEKIAMTLDTLVEINQFPLPNLIKMDIQGAEMDVLRGAKNCLRSCDDIIMELQHVDYNVGAPNRDKVIGYMDGVGFDLVSNITLTNVDGDYHFKKR
jgi:FkbM family methyltransferase